MVRFLVRTIGYLLLAGAFATLVIDGTRTIASSALVYTPLHEALETALPGREEQFKAFVETHAGAQAWEAVVRPVLGWPLSPILLVLGFIVVRLAAASEDEDDVGFVVRR
jgi:hypothetical protein